MSRRTKKIMGGKFISEGAYGCVFGNPPLKCEGEPKRRSNKYVSKLSSNETANSEVKRIDILKSIDSTGEYFILPIDSCKLNKSSIEPTNINADGQFAFVLPTISILVAAKPLS